MYVVHSQILGHGQFGRVYLAAYTPEDGRPQQQVAVKLLKDDATSAAKQSFLQECDAMFSLHHPYVLGIVGVALQQRPWLTVLEYMPYGDALRVMQACATWGYRVTSLELAHISAQVALGMAFILSRGVVHLDLAARNCLLGEENSVRIADFGTAQRLGSDGHGWRLDREMKLPVRWMSPEALDTKIFDEASDVWSFGVS